MADSEVMNINEATTTDYFYIYFQNESKNI